MGRRVERRKAKKMISPVKLVKAVGLVCVICYVVVISIQQQIKIADNRHMIYEYQQKIRDVNIAQEALKDELTHINEDEYLERMARQKLGLVKPNERIFIDASRVK